MKRLIFSLLALICLSAPSFASVCYVSEFANYGDGGMQVAKQPILADQAITVSAAHAESASFQPSTRLIRINCDVVVSFVVGASPAATANNARLVTGVVEYFQVNGSQQKISFITNN
jgi:hypothetical protein